MRRELPLHEPPRAHPGLLLPLDVGESDSLLRHPEVHQGGRGQCLQLQGAGDAFQDGRGSRQCLHTHRVEVQDVAHCKDSTGLSVDVTRARSRAGSQGPSCRSLTWTRVRFVLTKIRRFGDSEILH